MHKVVFAACYPRLNSVSKNLAEIIDEANHAGTEAAFPPLQVARNRNALAAADSFFFGCRGRSVRDEPAPPSEFSDS